MRSLTTSIIDMLRGAAFAGSVALATAGAATVANSAETETATFMVIAGGFTNTPTNIMIRKGFLAKHGVKGEMTALVGGPAVAAALMGGTTDFADSTPPVTWPLIKQGQCIRYLTAGQGVTGDFVAQPDLKLPNLSRGYPDSMKDMKGLRVGVVSLGSATQIWVDMLLKGAGMSPKDVTYISVGTNSTAVAAFQQKLVDVIVAYPPIFQTLQKSPGFQMVANWSGGNPPMLLNLVQSGIATKCSYADAHPQIVQAVCKASAEAFAFMMDPKNEAEMGEYVAGNMGVGPADGMALWRQYKSSFHGIVFTREKWEGQRPFMADGYVPSYEEHVVPGCAT